MSENQGVEKEIMGIYFVPENASGILERVNKDGLFVSFFASRAEIEKIL